MVVADHARHFLDQILFDLQVEAVRRRCDGQGTGIAGCRASRRLLDGQSKACKCVSALRQRQWHAYDLGCARHPQQHWSRDGQIHLLVVDNTTLRGAGAADVDDQLRDAFDVFDRLARVHAAFETMAGIGGEVVAARAPGHRARPPERGFDIDIARIVRDGSRVASHDAGQRLDLQVVGDHAHLLVHRNRGSIEQLELLPRFAPAHVQTAVDFVQIENMRWPSVLEHDVVRYVHQRADTALAATRKALHHPLRRAGPGIDIAHDAAGKTATQIAGADRDRQLVRAACRNRRESGRSERRTGQGRDFPCHAVNTQAMRQVGCELDRHQHVVELERFSHVLTQGRVRGQLQQTAVVIGQLQLARRAQHALAFNAAQLADLDQKRFAISTRRQLSAHQRTRYLDTDTRIGGAADDIE